MKSKLGTTVSTVLMLAGISLWSVSVLADEAGEANPASAPKSETRELAADANREAVNDAVDRIRAATAVDVEVDLVVRMTAPVAGD